MDLIYNLSMLVVGVLLFIGPIVLIVVIVKPGLLVKVTKKQWPRKRIALTGVSVALVGIIVFAMIGSATEPAGVKAARIMREQQQTTQQLADEQHKIKDLTPLKKTVIEKSKITYKTTEQDDGTLTKDEKKTSTEGIDGERTVIYEVTYVKGVETGRKTLSDIVTKPAVDKVVLVGTYVAPVVKAISTPISSATASSSANTYYANCTEARNAGVTPIYKGQPGYRSALDRDNDDVACE